MRKTEGYADQRKYFRVYFEDIPLSSELVIEEVAGKKMKTGKALVQVKDLSAGGLCFYSELKFPVSNDIKIGFFMNILEMDLYLSGKIIRHRVGESGKHEYGVEFQFNDSSKQQALFRLLGKLQIELSNSRKKYAKNIIKVA